MRQRFTAAGGALGVEAVPRDGTIEFSVRDTGTGIPKRSTSARIFEQRFFKVRWAKTAPGVGLASLAIAREIVQAPRRNHSA